MNKFFIWTSLIMLAFGIFIPSTTCILIFIGLLILWPIAYIYSRKCPKCSKWNAMKNIGSEIVDEKASTIKRQSRVKDSNGKVIRTEDVYVPATTTTYKMWRKCKYCGFENYKIKTKKTEN